MTINNFDKLKNVMSFSPGTYYVFIAMIRSKDCKDTEPVLNVKDNGQIVVKQWVVDSQESLDNYKEDMITVCNLFKCRLYMTLDRKSVKKTLLELKRQVDCMIETCVNSGEYVPSIRSILRMPNSAPQKKESSDKEKRWMVDVDVKDENVISFFEYMFNEHYMDTFETLNGYHIIINKKLNLCDNFNMLTEFMDAAGDGKYSVPKELKDSLKKCSIKDNALVLVYMNK